MIPYLLLCASIAGLRTTLGADAASPLLEDLSRTAEQWVKENADRDALKVLTASDQDRVRILFKEINRRMESTNVYALAPLKETAVRVLPLLKRSKSTRAYAEWLQNHLDYLEVSDDLRRAQPPPRTGTTPAPPTSEAQRTAWDKQLETRPLPAAAQTYVPRLKPLFAERGTPPSLVWLAEVESSFNPQARSPAGAAGLFQFMPATARSLGLALAPEDERLHPERSGRAAATYLAYLHGRFADWRLALAAYNAGETRVNNLLVQSKTRDYAVIAPKLPAETQLYVPKMEAVLRKRENVELTALSLARKG
jgi:membrane-bound lytic murein transglycosylase D